MNQGKRIKVVNPWYHLIDKFHMQNIQLSICNVLSLFHAFALRHELSAEDWERLKPLFWKCLGLLWRTRQEKDRVMLRACLISLQPRCIYYIIKRKRSVNLS